MSFSRLRIVAKNYRGFSDSHPLDFELRPGFTAFVGANNSGKSTVLRLFHELRQLFDRTRLMSLLRKPTDGGAQLGGDLEYLFHDRNERDLSVQINLVSPARSVTKPAAEPLAEIVFNIARNRGGTFTASSRSFPESKTPKPRLALGAPGEILVEEMLDTLSTLSTAMYVGSFRNVVNEAASTYFDMQIGTAFVGAWQSWKAGTSKYQIENILRVSEDIRRIFGFKTFEINSSQSNKTLNVAINGKSYRLDEQGSGLAHFIVVLGNAAMRKPGMILIDEPELGLHPNLQIDFLTSLASYTTGPVLFSTHSLGLARSVADDIYYVRSDGNASACGLYEQHPSVSQLIGELSYSSFQALGFNKIILVEGPTEVRTVQQFLRKVEKDHEVLLISLGGSSLIHGGAEHELAEFTRIGARVFALVDSERSSATATLSTDRAEFQASCTALGIESLVTQRRATENYFTDTAVKAALGGGMNALGHYDSLGKPKRWSKSDNWRIAREMTWEDIASTDVGAFLQRVIDA